MNAHRALEARDFVLVHGAWHGGWCWDPLRARLEAAGHRVHAPTLPGLAERAEELDATIGLAEHIACVIDAIETPDLNGVVLVGHSYGGMVITGVADAIPKRLGHLVYLDAALPRDGESLMSYGEPRPPEAIAAGEAALRAIAPDGFALPPVPPAMLGIPEGHPLHDWVRERLTVHPLKTLTDPIRLTRATPPDLPRIYIRCTEPTAMPTQFAYIAGQVANDPAWTYAELASGHDVMLTDPDAVARVLLDSVMRLSQSVIPGNPQEPA